MIKIDLVTEDIANEIIYNFNTRITKAKPSIKFLKAVCISRSEKSGVDHLPVWRLVRRSVECV